MNFILFYVPTSYRETWIVAQNLRDVHGCAAVGVGAIESSCKKTPLRR
jgi:hypothetical protein